MKPFHAIARAFRALLKKPPSSRPGPADADRDRVWIQAALKTRLSAHLRRDVGGD